MRKLISLLLLLALPSPGATNLFMYSTGTNLLTRWSTASVGYGCNGATAEVQAKRAGATEQGITAVSITHTPTSTAPPCLAGNSTAYYRYVSDPIASGSITSAGTIGAVVSCNESAAQLNAGYRFVVYRWSVKTGGIVKTIFTSATSTECAGARITITAAAAGSEGATTFDVGDRIIIDWQIMNVGSWAGNGSRTVTLVVGAASGTYGDTQVNFSDTLTFGSDTNNGRKILGD